MTKPRTGHTKGRAVTALFVAALLVGMGLLSYPSISNWWNERASSKAIASYVEAVEDASQSQSEEALKQANAYNAHLRQFDTAAILESPGAAGDYESLLDLTGTGMMGYVTIDKIDVQLPIYHGTDDTVLASGVGHLQGTSLPVGGEGTHCVLSAHRGLPSAQLFTHLDELEVGDTFSLSVLGETLVYEVDQISIVDPDEVNALAIEEGQDYCTLLTCTPYGINTQRLLVRGVRTDGESGMTLSSEATLLGKPLVAASLSILLLALLAATCAAARCATRSIRRYGKSTKA